jgi:hypothetical protein
MYKPQTNGRASRLRAHKNKEILLNITVACPPVPGRQKNAKRAPQAPEKRPQITDKRQKGCLGIRKEDAKVRKKTLNAKNRHPTSKNAKRAPQAQEKRPKTTD